MTCKHSAPANPLFCQAVCRTNKSHGTFLLLAACLAVIFLPGPAASHAASRNQQAEFSVRNPVARPDSCIVIRAQNQAARRRLPLQIEYDGVLLQRLAPPLPDANHDFHWQFRPRDFNLKPAALREGKHSLRVGFPGQPLSEPLNIVWHTQPPQLWAEIVKPFGSSKTAITGRVASNIPAANPVAVHLLFGLPEATLRVSLPVRQVTADSAGFAVFAFRMIIHGLPASLSGEIDFNQPFFALFASDIAGNVFFQQETFAWFAAPGQKRLGHRPMLTAEPRLALPAQPRRREITLDFRPVPPFLHPNFSDPVAVQLRARQRSPQSTELSWIRQNHVSPQEPLASVVWRMEEPLAICFTNKYLDEEPSPLENRCYRIQQIGRTGENWGSHTACVEKAEGEHGMPPLLAKAFSPDEASASTNKASRRDETAIAAVVGKHKPAIQDCYQRGLRRNRDLQGKVVVRFVVTQQGTVSEAKIVSSTLQNPVVEDCMLNRIKKWNDFGAAAPEEGETAFKQTYLFGY